MTHDFLFKMIKITSQTIASVGSPISKNYPVFWYGKTDFSQDHHGMPGLGVGFENTENGSRLTPE